MESLNEIDADLPSVLAKLPRSASAQGAVAQEPSRCQVALHLEPSPIHYTATPELLDVDVDRIHLVASVTTLAIVFTSLASLVTNSNTHRLILPPAVSDFT